MNATAMFWPMFALVALTFAVSILMYRRRAGEMRARRIHPQAVATASAMAGKLENVTAADNFRNLFEGPTLFYAACAVALALRLADPLLVALAWAYVAARCAHTAIHVTTNRVMRRFAAFATSHALLALLWIVLAVRVAGGSGG